MNIKTTVENAWHKTTNDFEKAKKTGDAYLWTEETLRCYFLGNLCEQNLEIVRILADTIFHLGDKEYKPDLVVDVKTDDKIEKVAFELKFYGAGWKNAWDKLLKYAAIGWDYGYFLGIGRSSQVEEVPKEPLRPESYGGKVYEVASLTHITSHLTTAPDFKIAEQMLRKALGYEMPYVVSEMLGAIAFGPNYTVAFDMTAEDKKCIIWAVLDEELIEKQKAKLESIDFNWVSFDDMYEGVVKPTRNITDAILIGKFPKNAYPENISNVKNSLFQFAQKMKLVSE